MYQLDPNITDKRQFKILAHNVKVILEERPYSRDMETYLERHVIDVNLISVQDNKNQLWVYCLHNTDNRSPSNTTNFIEWVLLSHIHLEQMCT